MPRGKTVRIGHYKEGAPTYASYRCPRLRAAFLKAHGFAAIAEAAQKANAFEQQGDEEQAQTWRRIETALLEMRGPHVS